MLDPHEFCELIIEPTLHNLDMHSNAAVNLLIGTALTESNLKHLEQMNSGPALGFYQIEPSTHKDVWDNFLTYRPELREKVTSFLVPRFAGESQLVWNLYYATVIARLIYYRRPESLPEATNLEGLASYWKDHYNTSKGKGKPQDFIDKIKKIF